MRSSPSSRSVRHVFVILAAVLCSILSLAATIHETLASGPFPFDHELRFDANPMRGSKRVPGLQITRTGAAEIDLWCASGKGHAVIIDNQITIVPISMQDNQCPADRLRADEDLLNNLTAVTAWRWDGQLLVLVGPRPLRFRPHSN
ncbi:MAG TPA: META domain-containing protein [Pseudorhodoplanes sp.]|nr:META domain-containing protein [Pseudorhodoplanes sp.]